MTLKRAIITSLCIFAFFGCGDENKQKKEQNTSEQTQGKILDKNANKDENLSKDSLTPKIPKKTRKKR